MLSVGDAVSVGMEGVVDSAVAVGVGAAGTWVVAVGSAISGMPKAGEISQPQMVQVWLVVSVAAAPGSWMDSSCFKLQPEQLRQ